MKIYNSLTKKIEEFIPFEGKTVRLYTCGPTVYNYAHIGNLRTYIVEDILEKALNYCGYNVKRVMNITDVGHLSGDSDDGEDKMVKSAEKENLSVLELAKFYTDAFKKDFELLNLKWPETVIPATSCIDVYINMIEKLLKDGFAYLSDGNVYFDVSKLKEYYVLTNQSMDEMIVGARNDVSHDDSKRNPQDFALWFTKSKFENQALKWNSPWGVGYPGWHIECSGISYKYLGEHLDIHTGGVDNKFPHHTNEIAQSESFLGHKWCNYWMHVEYLNIVNQKMSKSKGNFLTVTSLVEKGYNPKEYKLYCLGSHYRKELSFSLDKLNGAKSTYQMITKKISTLNNELNVEIETDRVNDYKNKFKSSLEDDLNTSMCITILIDMLKSDLNDTSKIYLVNDFDTVLGLSLLGFIGKKESIDISSEEEKIVLEKINERAELKKQKLYEEADNIRKELLDMGFVITDTREGTTYKKI